MVSLEQKIEKMYKNSMIILFLSAITALVSLGLLVGNSAHFNTIDDALVYINDESLSQLQDNIVSVNENIVVVNENIGVLQENVFSKINTTCD